jgi:uncharacterized protein (DUF427 family)
VSLTTGRGPHSANPAGRFSAPVPNPITYVEPFRRRVRALDGERPVVDSQRVLLVHRPGRPPTYAFPAADVTTPAAQPEPEAGGYVSVPWDAVEAWYEEEEQVFGHPRNPYHRVDCIPTDRRLRVEVGEVALVDTRHTMGVYETALEPRLYVARDAVDMAQLRPSPTTSYCPYKGTANYFTAALGDVVVTDVAWSYEHPRPESRPLGGLLCFDDRRTTVIQDLPPAATPEPSPTTPPEEIHP